MHGVSAVICICDVWPERWTSINDRLANLTRTVEPRT